MSDHIKSSTMMTTIGLDLGDRNAVYYNLESDGESLGEGKLRMTHEALERHFGSLEPSRIAIETGTHSPWVSRLLEKCGHQVIVANSRELRMIYGSHKKTDKTDAEMLARIARADPKLLKPIQHRSSDAQASLAILRARDSLVRARTSLVNHLRGAVKSAGGRITGCTTHTIHKKALEQVPEPLQRALLSVIESIGKLSAEIRAYDKTIEKLCEEKYPETRSLKQVAGVGSLTALAFVLIVEDPRRFSKSRKVGAYLGLTPRLDDSSGREPELRISKRGDAFLRRLLVSSAHYVLGPFGPDTDLQRFGKALEKRGAKNAKKRAVIAVSRKLSVLLHHLWLTGELYEPLYNTARKKKTA